MQQFDKVWVRGEGEFYVEGGPMSIRLPVTPIQDVVILTKVEWDSFKKVSEACVEDNVDLRRKIDTLAGVLNLKNRAIAQYERLFAEMERILDSQ